LRGLRPAETIEAAFNRILKAETACTAKLADARFLGVFQHFYPTNRFGLSSTGTHYVVLAYEVRFDQRPKVILDNQHSGYQWLHEFELKARNDVHENTKAYFLAEGKRGLVARSGGSRN
jgi:colanic acid biosynthesis protein WcaH